MACAVVLALSEACVVGGPIVPPAGPVASTGKTLTEVEPRIAVNAINTPGDADSLFRIAQPGSYYLTGNITGVAGKHGIEIAASGVTLDLNGFDLVGFAGMGAVDGVSVTQVGLKNIAVYNGSVRDWGDEGVDLVGTGFPQNCRLRAVLASGNAGNGIRIPANSTVVECSAHSNGGSGLQSDYSGVVISGCTVMNNALSGIEINSFGGSITGCSAYLNTVNGILVGGETSVYNCSVAGNATRGILTGGYCTVAGCAVGGSGSSSGISVGPGSSVLDCTSGANTGDGIVLSSNCLARGNTCRQNGFLAGTGAGINATGDNNRIEGNACSNADFGIFVAGTRNVIIRNGCSENTTNWTIQTNNIHGPIVDRTSPASAAVSGNSAPSSLGSTDPNANFTH